MEGAHCAKESQACFHPLVSLVIHYSIASLVAFGVHNILVDIDESSCAKTANDDVYIRQCVPLFVAIYALWLLLWRIGTSNNDHRWAIIYEYTWLCNVTLVLGAIAVYKNRPVVATAHAVAVGIDQLMWYVDLTGWTLR